MLKHSVGLNPHQFGTHTAAEFKEKLETFIEGAKEITRKHLENTTLTSRWETQWLKKRIRLKRDDGVHVFVDMETGDVLMPASWAAPAKHARGNIYDQWNGLKSMGPYGPAYLR